MLSVFYYVVSRFYMKLKKKKDEHVSYISESRSENFRSRTDLYFNVSLQTKEMHFWWSSSSFSYFLSKEVVSRETDVKNFCELKLALLWNSVEFVTVQNIAVSDSFKIKVSWLQQEREYWRGLYLKKKKKKNLYQFMS